MTRSMAYKGSLTREHFLFYEIRMAARLYLAHLDFNEALATSKAQNLFQFPTEREIKSTAQACYRRLDGLNNIQLVEHLAEAPTEIAKQINLYAIMRDNRLVWELMVDLIGEKYRALDMTFTRKDINVFFSQVQAQDEKVAAWSENTVQKIKSVLVRCLVETGYLDNHRDTILHPVYLHDELRQGIYANHDEAALPAFNYFE